MHVSKWIARCVTCQNIIQLVHFCSRTRYACVIFAVCITHYFAIIMFCKHLHFMHIIYEAIALPHSLTMMLKFCVRCMPHSWFYSKCEILHMNIAHFPLAKFYKHMNISLSIYTTCHHPQRIFEFFFYLFLAILEAYLWSFLGLSFAAGAEHGCACVGMALVYIPLKWHSITNVARWKKSYRNNA